MPEDAEVEDTSPNDAEHVFEALIGIVAGLVIWITMGGAVFEHTLLTILVAALVLGGLAWLALPFVLDRER